MSESTLAAEAGTETEKALTIRVHDGDNVAIVVNARGLPAGTALADGTVLVEGVPQGHKVALTDLAEGDAVIRYGEVIGYAVKPLPRGSWINEHAVKLPGKARGLHLRGLPQRRRHGRHEERARHHDQCAVRGRRDGLRGRPHQA